MRLQRQLLALGMAAVSISGLMAQQSGEQWRPQYHFSPRRHWTNDPNGLIFFEGEYHLFFQYNPFGDKWGHMSWGHAVSRDLVHWEELPVALREENGIMIFTGSTVIDEHNSSGFCSGGKPCMVAIYTGHTPAGNGKPALQTQNLAYSNDRGRNWTKYQANPVLDRHMSDFRDPKVFWSDKSKRWVMAVALPDDHKVLVYHSKDLKDWRQVSEFGPAGATGGQWECPELFQAPVEGKPGETRWVMKVGLNPGGLQGGSGEQYFIGRFDGKRFKNSNPANLTLWTDYGKDCYCALTFNNLPKSRLNPVAMGWMDNWQYAADLPTAPLWRGQMTVPRELSLRQTAEGLRLVQHPVAAVETLRSGEKIITGQEIEGVNEVLASADSQVARSSEIAVKIELGKAQTAAIHLGGLVIGYDRAKSLLYVDRSHAGDVSFSPKFPARTEAPLRVANGTLELRILMDRDSVEVFAENGSIAMTNLYFPTGEKQHLRIFSEGGNLQFVSVHLWSLDPKEPQPQ